MVAESFVLSRLLCKRILHNSSTKALNKLAKYHKIAQKIKISKSDHTQWISMEVVIKNMLLLQLFSIEMEIS